MQATAPVPGSLANAVVLLDDGPVPPLEGRSVPYGLIKLRNVGDWGLAVGGLDATGTLLQPHIYLNAGEALSRFFPSANAVKIILVGEKQDDNLDYDGTEQAILQYDVPWYG